MTAGLSSASACVRVIIRDVAGKHSWDSAVLYGPPSCSTNSPAHSLLTHLQSPHNKDLRLPSPTGGPPNNVGVRTEDGDDEGQEERCMEEERSEDEEPDYQGERDGEGMKASGDKEEQRECEDSGEAEGGLVVEEESSEQQLKEEPGSEQLLAPPQAKRVCREAVPAWDSLREGDDALDEMLQYLGYSSPECLQRAGHFILLQT